MRTFLIALVVAMFAAQPSEATSYLGHLHGVVTKGGHAHWLFPPGEPTPTEIVVSDLTGQPIDIFFRADSDLLDPDFGYTYTYTNVKVRLSLPVQQYGFTFLPEQVSTAASSDWAISSFVGNEKSGSLQHATNTFSLLQSVSFSFANGSSVFNLLSGTGQASAVELCCEYVTSYSAQYNLVAGNVVALSVPEPTIWFVMLVGVGMIGAALRSARLHRTGSMTDSL